MKNLGFLDPGSDHPDLAKGSKMELPFWMVEGLRSNQELDVIYLVFNFHRENGSKHENQDDNNYSRFHKKI